MRGITPQQLLMRKKNYALATLKLYAEFFAAPFLDQGAFQDFAMKSPTTQEWVSIYSSRLWQAFTKMDPNNPSDGYRQYKNAIFGGNACKGIINGDTRLAENLLQSSPALATIINMSSRKIIEKWYRQHPETIKRRHNRSNKKPFTEIQMPKLSDEEIYQLVKANRLYGEKHRESLIDKNIKMMKYRAPYNKTIALIRENAESYFKKNKPGISGMLKALAIRLEKLVSHQFPPARTYSTEMETTKFKVIFNDQIKFVKNFSSAIKPLRQKIAELQRTATKKKDAHSKDAKQYSDAVAAGEKLLSTLEQNFTDYLSGHIKETAKNCAEAIEEAKNSQFVEVRGSESLLARLALAIKNLFTKQTHGRFMSFIETSGLTAVKLTGAHIEKLANNLPPAPGLLTP